MKRMQRAGESLGKKAADRTSDAFHLAKSSLNAVAYMLLPFASIFRTGIDFQRSQV
jgi:hypothetical protein